MDDELVIAELTLRLVFDETEGELLQITADEDNQPTTIQALGMLTLAQHSYLYSERYDIEADDDDEE